MGLETGISEDFRQLTCQIQGFQAQRKVGVQHLQTALLPFSVGNRFEAQIIGGREAVPHSRPYMVSLQKAKSHVCGGVLVHQKWVLTAAHCLSEPLQQLKLVFGLHSLHDPQDPGLTFYIKQAIKHPGYNLKYENDLALLKLDGRVKPNKNVKPLALPRKPRDKPAEGSRCSTAGWGITRQGGHLARSLQELDLRLLDTRMCNNSRFWNGVLTDSMLCLKAGAKGQAPCKGDSGGPLVCGKGKVDGILSFSSKNCTDIFKPTVATAVAPYSSWIRKVIGRWSP